MTTSALPLLAPVYRRARVGGRDVGGVAYYFTTVGQRDGFTDGRWPIASPVRP